MLFFLIPYAALAALLYSLLSTFSCSIFRALPEKSGRQDLNLRPLDPQSSALAKLRHAPDISSLIFVSYDSIY